MKILVIGGGARVHVIAESAARSGEVFAFLKNRNPGILKLAKKHKIGSETSAKTVAKFAEANKIDVAVVGPESALEAGVVNELSKMDIPAVGPDKTSAKLETSKEFMRGLLEKYKIPGRIQYGVFTDVDKASDYIHDFDGQVVIKPVTWREREGQTPLLRHTGNGTRYIEFYPASGGTDYTLDGTPCQRGDVTELMKPPSKGGGVVYRTPKLTSILAAKINKVNYLVVAD